MSSSSVTLSEIFTPLYNFLKTSSLDKITISNIITQQWNCFKIQTEEEDLNSLMKILEEIDDEIINGERRRYLKSLQNIDQVFSRFYISILENKMMNMMSRH